MDGTTIDFDIDNLLKEKDFDSEKDKYAFTGPKYSCRLLNIDLK